MQRSPARIHEPLPANADHSRDQSGLRSADEDGQARNQAVEEVEHAHGSDADEVEERALHAQIREGLVQALIDPVSAPAIGVCLHRCPLLSMTGCG